MWQRRTYRAVYTVTIGGAIYVIHAFQKEVQGRYCYTEVGDGTGAAAVKKLRSEVKNAEKRRS